MPLYQTSVLKNYLKRQDKETVAKAFKKFSKYFHNTSIQQNIRESKEEQFQEGFLRELFVDILGYTLNPHPNFNLTTELKNEKGAKKADGAILLDGNALGVIELKSTKTKDLESIRQQAFDYKANQTGCVYVVTSNFEKLRFYINNAVEFEEFDLFMLTESQFELLYLCLHKNNLLSNVPLKIKEASVREEEVITKKFYNDYSLFKRELFRDLVKLNMKNEVFRSEFNREDTERANKNIKHNLFKKSQKLIDRFLFIFFAEDRDLLPPNSTLKILEQWNKLKDLDAYTPLYERFKLYFGYLDTGRKGTDKGAEIFAYNGGLFKPDPILDSLQISDELLFKHTEALSKYDFESQVDVNILGHIFENSLNEIESVNAEIEGVEFDKQKTKRKKDGVFYTPKYITKYIVDNTVGKLCAEKKAELKIIDEEYTKNRKGRTTAKLKELKDQLEAYRQWLLQITICDPACGSGAFLNQALDFLIKEHHYIDELQTSMLGGGFVFHNIENTVLENNIFGVDLNEESVEIAKLSLWLRTAQPRRKLNDLSSNIKCGNSLIDDPKVAGNKAFKWQDEFPNVFKEKDKKAFHITTATHDSRTSQRMVDYKVRALRDNGLNTKAQPIWLEPEDEILITNTIAEIIKEDELNVMAYNICGDHIHLLLVCEEDEAPKIVGKIKAITSKEYNTAIGITTRGNVPLSEKEGNDSYTITRGHVPLSTEKEEVPLLNKKEKKTYNSLWTQKFGCKEIDDEKQLWNTVEYIRTNREKHELPALRSNKGTCPLVEKGIENELFYCSYEHAFRTEYKGGFDVVIGNPPYVFARDNFKQEEKDFFVKEYVSAKYQINTYLLFIEKTVRILKGKGIYGLIIPNSWLMMYSGEGLRKFLLETNKLNQIINLAGYSFEDANVETVILLAEKETIKNENSIQILLNNGNEFYFSHSKQQTEFTNNDGFEFKVFLDDESDIMNLKLNENSFPLNDLVEIKAGLQAYEKDKGEPKQTAEDVVNRIYDYDYQFDENTFKYLEGKDVGRYYTNWSGLYLRYGKHLAAPRTFNLFDGKKIIIREITGNFPKCLIATYSEDVYLYNRSNIAIVEKVNSEISLKYITTILNSKLLSYYFVKNTAKSVRKLFPKIILNDLRKFPIKKIIISDQQPFIEKADLMLSLNNEKQQMSGNFTQLLQSKFNIEKLTTKLQNWHELEFSEFLKELEKARKQSATATTTRGHVPLSLQQEAEWMQYFNEQKQKAQTLKAEIEKTDKEIDQMVYELYGLSEEEIKIVEGSK